MDAFAFIPARGGSKGIPGKNLKMVGGRPLIGRTVSAARMAGLRTFVSTDDARIAAAAQAAGAEIINRPSEIAGDTASSESALIHALGVCQSRFGRHPEWTVFLQCTSPFVSPGDVARALDLAAAGNDCVFSAAPSHRFLWKAGSDSEGVIGVNHDRARRPRRQERAPEWMETGAVYVMRTAGFLDNRHRFFGRVAPCPVDPNRALEIDEPSDLVVAEALAPVFDAEDRLQALPAAPHALVFDFDGVMTDDRVLVMEDGREAVLCRRGDGLGIARLRGRLPMLILSTEENRVVAARGDKLKLPVIHGSRDKWADLSSWLAAVGVIPERVIYVGNDVNDIACLSRVGCGVVPADAHPEARAHARLILSHSGGEGAVREICDLVLKRLESSR